MTWQLALICLLASLIAVAAGVLLATWQKAPAWLTQIVTLALLLLAFVWLRALFGV